MAEIFSDSTAVVRAFGKPAFFGTLTCNPPLLPNQTPNDRPDLITRVFKMKLKQLIKMIKEDNVFGYCLAFVMIFAFQKRGLPRADWLVILRRQGCPRRKMRKTSSSAPRSQERAPAHPYVLKC